MFYSRDESKCHWDLQLRGRFAMCASVQITSCWSCWPKMLCYCFTSRRKLLTPTQRVSLLVAVSCWQTCCGFVCRSQEAVVRHHGRGPWPWAPTRGEETAEGGDAEVSSALPPFVCPLLFSITPLLPSPLLSSPLLTLSVDLLFPLNKYTHLTSGLTLSAGGIGAYLFLTMGL